MSNTERDRAHREKMASKKAERAQPEQTRLTRQLAKGARIRGNYSDTPKGEKRTRKPVYT